jgi:hypothetical protein
MSIVSFVLPAPFAAIIYSSVIEYDGPVPVLPVAVPLTVPVELNGVELSVVPEKSALVELIRVSSVRFHPEVNMFDVKVLRKPCAADRGPVMPESVTKTVNVPAVEVTKSVVELSNTTGGEVPDAPLTSTVEKVP